MKQNFQMSVLLTAFTIFLTGNAMSAEWFQTWDRLEYQEWASEIPEGYLLHIIRKENDAYLVVQAKLIMGEKGLPGFEVIEQCTFSNKQDALKQVHEWEKSALISSHSI